MKRFIVLSIMVLCGLVGFIVPSAIADKPPTPPGQGDCSHGNTGKDCKPDPSTNGKDCDPHGNNGGTNEDHCNGTTTNETTSTTRTTTTNGTTSTGETTTTNGGTTSTTDTHQTTSSPTETSGQTTSTTPVTTVTTPTNPTPDNAPAIKSGGKGKGHGKGKGELPFTGLELPILIVLTGMFLTSGIILRKVTNGPRS
jgi:hypothetical protein